MAAATYSGPATAAEAPAASCPARAGQPPRSAAAHSPTLWLRPPPPRLGSDACARARRILNAGDALMPHASGRQGGTDGVCAPLEKYGRSRPLSMLSITWCRTGYSPRSLSSALFSSTWKLHPVRAIAVRVRTAHCGHRHRIRGRSTTRRAVYIQWERSGLCAHRCAGGDPEWVSRNSVVRRYRSLQAWLAAHLGCRLRSVDTAEAAPAPHHGQLPKEASRA